MMCNLYCYKFTDKTTYSICDNISILFSFLKTSIKSLSVNVKNVTVIALPLNNATEPER